MTNVAGIATPANKHQNAARLLPNLNAIVTPSEVVRTNPAAIAMTKIRIAGELQSTEPDGFIGNPCSM